MFNIAIVRAFLIALFSFLFINCDQRISFDELATADVQVVSFNIRYGTADDGLDSWDYRSQLVIELLREESADFVGIQEALRFQLDEILDAFPEYGEIGVGRDDGKQKGEYSSILYRTSRFLVEEQGTFWYSNTPEIPGSMDWGNTITRICTWGRFRDKATECSFFVFNTHFDHRSQESRERSAELLALEVERLAGNQPTIVAGDFNAGEENPAIRYLLNKGSLSFQAEGSRTPAPLVDTYRQIHAEAADVGTFNGFTGEVTGEKIDYVFTSPGIGIQGSRINRRHFGRRYPSDHFPVSAILNVCRESRNVERE